MRDRVESSRPAATDPPSRRGVQEELADWVRRAKRARPGMMIAIGETSGRPSASAQEFIPEGEAIMEMESLRDLFLDELRDMYHAEGQMIKSLPRMAKKADSDELRTAFEQHLEETRKQQERLQEVFQLFEEKPKTKVCKGMQGILEEGKEMMQEDIDADVLDAALIAAAQRAEHYEIAVYGTLRTYAQLLGNEEAADILQEILDEEGTTDKKLTALAEKLNVEAQSDA
jgi:ferritin-like metal-binding protein YciE